MDIGTKIKRLREHKNISQTALASQLGIAQNTLGLIESGDTKKIDFF
jgi:transcriptional regulator with XRE-family HTH domain